MEGNGRSGYPLVEVEIPLNGMFNGKVWWALLETMRVELDIDANGILTVSVLDQNNSKLHQVNVSNEKVFGKSTPSFCSLCCCLKSFVRVV